MIDSETLLNLPGYQITGITRSGSTLTICARYTGHISCPHCGREKRRLKDTYTRRIRHESWGARQVVLEVQCHKWKCLECDRYFHQRLPGILKGQHSTEAFRRQIFELHWNGINRSRLARKEGIGAATVERHFRHFLDRLGSERDRNCPRVLGIDEHFFSRRQGYATTFCDLAKHNVFDVVLGRSEAALEGYLSKLKGKDKVRVVCMDLSSTYRAIVRKHFPNALIVADRFHVVRLVNFQFLAVWRFLDPDGSKNRGLLSLLRRPAERLSPDQKRRLQQYLQSQPAIAAVYLFRERLYQLLIHKHCKARVCRKLVPELLQIIEQLRESGFAAMNTLGATIDSWKEEIARMWRFTRSNGITEGFHTKMEVLQRQAYGFRNFKNYRSRVVVMCR